MSELDLIVRQGIVLAEDGARIADVGVLDGAFASIEESLDATAAYEIDASGLHVLPGGVDPHVHCNEPGRTDWEGFATGTRALAAGGMTSFFDMPLSSSPPTIDGESFDRKHDAARASSLVDFGLWGGLVPGNLQELAELAERGVIGFKAFMAPSGLDEFPAVDDLTLLEGMQRAAELGLPVAVHAESGPLVEGLARRARREGRTSALDFAATRPLVAELEAIGRAITFAEETGCALHVVHVSSGRGVALVARARERGVDVSCETCPHYLILDEADVEALGALAKCAPPLRDATARHGLWEGLRAGALEMIASDHSPCPPERKGGASFFTAWGGISGAQTTLPLLLTESAEHGIALEVVARAISTAAAERFGLPRKGRIAVGADADMAVVDLATATAVRSEELLYRHPISAWVGRRLRARVVHTLVRGRTVVRDGRAVAEPEGRLLTPARQPDRAGRGTVSKRRKTG